MIVYPWSLPIPLMSVSRTSDLDPAAEVLHDLRLSGSFYCRSELTASWGLRMPAWEGGAHYHVAAQGSCWIRVGDEAPVALERGDLVVLPHGRGHELVDRPGSLALSVEELPKERIGKSAAVLRHGGGGEPALVVCGGVRFEPHPLIELLPEILFVRAQQADTEPWIRTTLEALTHEAAHPRPGTETVITRLSDILVIGAIRAWLEHGAEARGGWLGALHDERIGQALALMHRATDEPWTVDSLAERVEMSRASFAERFTRLVGSSPMSYLKGLRMQLATAWIREDRVPLAEVAKRLGYSSDAAFSRAYKRHMGVPPGAARAHGLPD